MRGGVKASGGHAPGGRPNQRWSRLEPNIVSIEKTTAESVGLNARFIEASSPPRVEFNKNVVPGGLPSAQPKEGEPAPEGMKWLAITVEFGPTRGEVSVPLRRIRLLDESKRKYRLISIGGSASASFLDFREYDKYLLVAPPKFVVHSTTSSKNTLLFAVPAKAKRVTLAF